MIWLRRTSSPRRRALRKQAMHCIIWSGLSFSVKMLQHSDICFHSQLPDTFAAFHGNDLICLCLIGCSLQEGCARFQRTEKPRIFCFPNWKYEDKPMHGLLECTGCNPKSLLKKDHRAFPTNRNWQAILSALRCIKLCYVETYHSILCCYTCALPAIKKMKGKKCSLTVAQA